MSRANYCDDLDPWDLIRWRGAVASAIRGARGQAFLKEMLLALDALEVPELIANDLVRYSHEAGHEPHVEVCAIGAVGLARGTEMQPLDPEHSHKIASVFGIADALVREIEYVNDECSIAYQTAAERFTAVRRWVENQIEEAE